MRHMKCGTIYGVGRALWRGLQVDGIRLIFGPGADQLGPGARSAHGQPGGLTTLCQFLLARCSISNLTLP